MFDKKISKAILSLVLSILFSISIFNKAANAGDVLVFAVHPYLPEEELKKKFKPMAEYLSHEMGKTVNVRIGGNYEEHIQFIGLNKVDIAYMGPASYVHMINEFGDKPVLARLEVNGHPWFQGNIVTRDNSTIKTLADLKGKRIAYGDPKSTMSYIVPYHMLYVAGVYSDVTTRHQFLYSHNNVALGILSGDFDAGAVKPEVFRKYESAGLRTIAKTPKISEHLFVVRNDLPGKEIEMLRNALLKMSSTDEGIKALRTIKDSITGLVEASSSDYDNLRKIIAESKDIP
ncbi:MAG: phosphate/phosphite/phosphonate ABC transporter substrate-binding protein [Gammaproteobacteria bacterium]|nr:phosphate/phosphite/phosphonate ABC transporter substrate-binding protein [Gammaproteobacteria bacterium]